MTARRVGVLRMVGLDLVGPLVVYRLCRGLGVPTVWSLVLSGCSPAVGVLIDWLRWRTLEVVGAVVLGGIAVSVVLALLTDDPKVVLLEGAATTAGFGIVCLLSLSRRRPLIFYFAQAFYGGRHTDSGAEFDDEFDRFAEARSFWRRVTVVWAVTYLLEGAALAVVVQNATTATSLVFNRSLSWPVTALLIGWTIWSGNRLRAEKPADPPPITALTGR